MTPNGHGSAKERPEAAAVVPGGEGGSGDKSKAVAEAASTPNGSSSLRAETERSRGGVAGGAVGEKAVHPPSSPGEQSSKTAAAATALATAGQKDRSTPSPPVRAGATREERHGTERMVAAAEAWCGAEATSLKRDAQMATKRSWDDFENNAGTVAKAAAAALPPDGGGRGGGAHPARRTTSPGCGGSSHAGSAKDSSSSSSPPEAGTRCPSRDKPSQLAAAAAASSWSSPDCRPRAAPAGLPVTRRQEAVEPPEVVTARAALEKAQDLIGVDLPSLDKGPEADCVLCHVPRGAFLRAERGSKVGWCHALCAFSKGLVIEDRVVKVGWWGAVLFFSCPEQGVVFGVAGWVVLTGTARDRFPT